MIREVTLRRFKRFADETFPLSGHVVLAGQNNCGKTTVLQAIAAWTLTLRRWRELNDFQKHGGAYTKAPMARQAFSAVPLRSFDLLWRNRNAEATIEIALTAETLPTQPITMEVISDSTEQVYVRPRRDVDAEVLRTLELETVYVSGMTGLSLVEPVYTPEYVQTLLGSMKPGDVIRNLLLQVAQTDRWTPLRDTVKRLFDMDLQVPQTPGGQITCEYIVPASGVRFDLLSAGTGFQQVILLLASLLSRPRSVFLVDEPDAHLHVFLQDSILSELNDAAAKAGSQIILATHSEVIFNATPPEQLCILMGGRPRRLATPQDRERLRAAMGVLSQSDMVTALDAPGVLYVEDYTDLHLLRAWAERLDHPVAAYLARAPFWKPLVWEPREGARGIRAQDHFDALRAVRPDLSGVLLIDSDGKARGVQPSADVQPDRLNRLAWNRYEGESYLVHPAVLARFLESKGVTDAGAALRASLLRMFTAPEFVDAFYANPHQPPPLVDLYLKNTKARTDILGTLLEGSGLHGFPYQRFSEIAMMMERDEIHPEVREKLDLIQRALRL